MRRLEIETSKPPDEPAFRVDSILERGYRDGREYRGHARVSVVETTGGGEPIRQIEVVQMGYVD